MYNLCVKNGRNGNFFVRVPENLISNWIHTKVKMMDFNNKNCYSYEERVVLGIDGGGTKTAFCVANYNGHICEYFIDHGSNPNDIGSEECLEILSRGIQKALTDFKELSEIFCGIAGVATGGQIDFLTEELINRFPDKKIVVNSDYENILAMDEQSDMAIISGTGSVVCVRTNEGYAHLGGWGYLFDKEGSAYDIGREAVFTSLEEEELLKPHSLISDILKEQLNVSKVRDAVGSMYKGGKPYIASLAKSVFQAYQANDEKAIEIIDKNAKRLAELLNSAVKQYNVLPRAVAGGGMFEHYGDIMLEHMSKYTDVKVVIPNCAPIYGACRRARKLADDTVPSEFQQNFTESYKEIRK